MPKHKPLPSTNPLHIAVFVVNSALIVLALLYLLPYIFGAQLVMSDDASFGAVILYYAGILLGALLVLPITVILDILYLRHDPTGWKKAATITSLAISAIALFTLFALFATSML